MSGLSVRDRWLRAFGSESGPDPATRHVLLALGYYYMSPDGDRCYPGLREISRVTGWNKDTVRSHLRIAEDKG